MNFEIEELKLAITKLSEEVKNLKSTYNIKPVVLTGDALKNYENLIIDSPLAARIFLCFANYSGSNRKIIVTNKVLCNIFKKTRLTIVNAISVLEKKGFLFVFSVGMIPVYILNKKYFSLIHKKKGFSHIEYLDTVLLLDENESNKKSERLKSIENINFLDI